MKLHILLTKELKESIPNTIHIIHSFGELPVIFPNQILEGENVFIEGEKTDIINWLKPFDGVPIGNGNPITEQFTICHIKENPLL